MFAEFDAKNNWLKTGAAISFNEMPADAIAFLRQNYKNKVLRNTFRIVKKSGETNYETQIENKNILFNEHGNFVKEETVYH